MRFEARGRLNGVRIEACRRFLFSMVFDRLPERGLRPEEITFTGPWQIRDLEAAPLAKSGSAEGTPHGDYPEAGMVAAERAAMQQRGSWEPLEILGEEERREISLPDADYLVIAELPGKGGVGIRRGDESGAAYRLLYDGSRPEQVL